MRRPGYICRMRSFAVALLALLAMAAVAGCGSETDEAVAPSATVTESTPETTRETAPALSGVTLDGDAITLGDFRGRPVLINVWSSW